MYSSSHRNNRWQLYLSYFRAYNPQLKGKDVFRLASQSYRRWIKSGLNLIDWEQIDGFDVGHTSSSLKRNLEEVFSSPY